jgi:hypothetical protein
VHRARWCLCDQESFHSELEFLWTIFRKKAAVIDRPNRPSAHRRQSHCHQRDLLDMSTNSSHISMLMSKHNIESVGLPPEEDPQPPSACEWLETQDSWLQVCAVFPAGVVESASGKPAVPSGSGSRSTITTSIWSNRTKLAMAEHSINLGHCSKLQVSTTLHQGGGTWTGWLGRLLRFESRPNNMNREDGLRLGRSWKPLIHPVKGCRKQGCSTVSPHLATRSHCPYQDIIWPQPAHFLLLILPFLPIFSFCVLYHVHTPSHMSAITCWFTVVPYKGPFPCSFSSVIIPY